MANARRNVGIFQSATKKDYQLEKSNSNEFVLTVTHPTFIYDEFKRFAAIETANFVFSINGYEEVKLHVMASTPVLFDKVDKQFRSIMQFLNNNKLNTREYDEIIHLYENFLRVNALKEYTNSGKRHGSDDSHRPGSGNTTF